MELSVSGFPGPLRQGSVDSDPESSKLRGLFGKKAEARSADSRPPTRPNTEEFILPSTSSSSLKSSQVTPSDEHDTYAQMVLSSQEPLPSIPQRQRKVSVPRRSPQVKKQTSLGRLEIGTGSRAISGSPTMNPLPTPPALASQDPLMKNIEPTSPLRRPLPLVPNTKPIVESKKDSAPRTAGPSQGPPSSVLISKPSRPRAHTTSPSAVSVRYQPLVVDVNTKGSRAPSPSTGSPGGQIRRLPAIPVSAIKPSPPALLPRHGPRPACVKRPSTSSGPSNGFNPNGRQSPLDAIPSSWASKPVDLNPTQRAQSPSQMASSSSLSASSSRALPRIQVAPRARSHSRPRREQSEGPPSRSRTPVSASPRHTRILSPVSLASTSSSSPSRTSVRTSSLLTPATSPTSSPLLPLSPPNANRFLSAYADSPVPPSTPRSKFVKEAAVVDPSSSVGTPPHRRPVEKLSNDVPTRDTSSSLEAPPEVYIDNEDCSSGMSRSPSPMRYARPNSRGSLSDDSSDYSRSRSRAVRDQLRSYRRSYRGPKSPSRSPSPIQYARRKSLEGLDEIATSTSPKRREQPRSYQFDYKAAQDSSPFLRAASPDRKSSDNVSKTNSSKSTSIRTRRGRSKGSRHSRASRSRSPRWPRFGSPAGSVIDISFPLTQEHQNPGRPSLEHRRASRSISHLDSRGSLAANASGSGSSWRTAVGGSWEEVSKAGKKQWIDMYNDDSAVVVTTIQPAKDVWKGEGMNRIVPNRKGLPWP